MSTLTPAGAGALVRSIHSNWGLKRDLIALIGAYPEGLHATYRELAAHFGNDERWTYRCLRELTTDHRVVLTSPGRGRGKSIYRINPYLAQYSRVPFRHGVEEAARRIREAMTEDIEATLFGPEDALERGTEPVVPRSVPRSNAALRPPDPPAADVVPRSNAALREPCAAFERGTERGTTGRSAKSSSLPREVDQQSSVVGSGPEGAKEADPDPVIDGLRLAIQRHNRWKFFRGKPVVVLRKLVALYGVQAVRDGIARTAPVSYPLDFMDALAVELAPVVEASPDARPPAPDPAPKVFEAEGLRAPDIAYIGGVEAARRARAAALGAPQTVSGLGHNGRRHPAVGGDPS